MPQGATSHFTSAGVIGKHCVPSQARFMPSASRSAKVKTVFPLPVVVLARADIAARAVKMDMKCRGYGQLPHKTCDTGKIRVGDTRTVITLGMTGVITQYGNGRILIPKTDERHLRVDYAFGRDPPARGLCTWYLAHTGDFSRAVENTAVGCDFLYPGSADTHLGEWLCPG